MVVSAVVDGFYAAWCELAEMLELDGEALAEGNIEADVEAGGRRSLS